MRRHNIITDVSGRLEKYNLEDVAIAFTNETEAAILIPGKVKFEAMRVLLQFGMHRKKAGNRVYAAGICLLLEDFLQDIDQVVIDDELPGWGVAIKQRLGRCETMPNHYRTLQRTHIAN